MDTRPDAPQTDRQEMPELSREQTLRLLQTAADKLQALVDDLRKDMVPLRGILSLLEDAKMAALLQALGEDV